MRAPRRALLGSVASIVLGGCLGGGGRATPTSRPDLDGDGVPDHADDYPDDPERAVRTSRVGGTPTLQPGDYSAVALTNSPRGKGEILHYELSVDGETPVDCLVFERDAYDAYVDGARDVPVVDEYSRTAVTETSLTARLDRGEYVLALDYTAQSTPPGAAPVEVDWVVELADPAPTETA